MFCEWGSKCTGVSMGTGKEGGGYNRRVTVWVIGGICVLQFKTLVEFW